MARRLTDWTLFFTVLVMLCFGLIMVYSSTSITAAFRGKDPDALFLRQLAVAVGGFLVLMWLKKQNYLLLKDPLWAFIPLGLVMALLPVAFLMDPKTHRWIRMAGFQLQPSEFAKPALIVFLAYFLTRRMPAVNSPHTLLPVTLAFVITSGVVAISDLGTAVALIVPAVALLYVSGIQRRHLALAACLAGLAFAGAVVAKPYRLARVIAFVDPEYKLISKIDPNGKIKAYVGSSHATSTPNYQIEQAKIALGSGGVLGLGIMQGRQKLLYLPEAHTDCIYAVVGEELGLWGTSALLAGFFVLFWRGFRLFYLAKDDFGRFLALGISISILVQALVNVSVVLDLGPAKGIPLPLISYGGSSLLSSLVSLGILMSVSEDAQWLERAS
ncbi:MAG: FtsW/RodA/SpoVE family cell cycle protein [Bryobacter sp.]|nr:FtsW/RodA/SpoVE family cell cycle protein [Bryobacter sp.]